MAAPAIHGNEEGIRFRFDADRSRRVLPGGPRPKEARRTERSFPAFLSFKKCRCSPDRARPKKERKILPFSLLEFPPNSSIHPLIESRREEGGIGEKKVESVEERSKFSRCFLDSKTFCLCFPSFLMFQARD